MNTLFNKNKIALLASLLVIAAASLTVSFADVPVQPTNIVDCSCVTSNSQTCASANLGLLGMMVDSTVSSCDASGNYSVQQIVDGTNNTPGIVGSTQSSGNNNKAIGSVVQNCAITIGLPMVDGYLTTEFKCSSSLPGFNTLVTSILSAFPGTLGTSSGQACLRANNVRGQLHYTGQTLFTGLSIGGINSTIGGVTGGSGTGNNGGPGLSYRMVDNYSCY